MAKETKSKKEPKLLKENSAKRLADSGTKKLKAGETKKIGVSSRQSQKNQTHLPGQRRRKRFAPETQRRRCRD